MPPPTSKTDDAKPGLREIERQRFDQALGQESDPTMLILRAHLFSESLIERFILLKLPRGDRVLEGTSLSYAQKLSLAASFDDINDSVISSLKGLNRLRNQCAHELGRAISSQDVVRIGSPLGEVFTTTHRQAAYEPIPTLRKVLSYVCGYITGVCHSLEETSGRTDSVAESAGAEEGVSANQMPGEPEHGQSEV